MFRKRVVAMLGKVFKAYDIREKYPDPLNETLAWRIGRGVAQFLQEQAQASGETDPMMRYIVVGRDMRPHSPKLADALIRGIQDAGANVIDVGLVDTPFAYFAVNHLGCAGAVMTTASHNPIEYNGFKISGMKARPIGQGSGLEKVLKYSAMARPDKPLGNTGRVDKRDLWKAYRKHVLSFLDLQDRSFRVAVDASNGMAGTTIPRIYSEKDCNTENLTILPLNFENDKGVFVHPPNPLVPENLRSLQEQVLAEKADFGVCFDGDADRCMIVDENAGLVACDLLTALLAEWFLKLHPGSAIVYDLRSSRIVEETIRRAGGKPVRSRVGHVFMKREMAQHQAVFGGELSGHMYFRDNFNADSGMIAFATVLSLLADRGESVSTLVRPFRRYHQSGEINFIVEEPGDILEELEDDFHRTAKIDHLDGVTIDCWDTEGWWANIRTSNTEPVLRLNMEARNENLLNEQLERMKPLLGTHVRG